MRPSRSSLATVLVLAVALAGCQSGDVQGDYAEGESAQSPAAKPETKSMAKGVGEDAKAAVQGSAKQVQGAAQGAAAAVTAALPKATDFTLKDTAGQSHHLADYLGKGKVVVLEWFNPDCPFVKAYHENTKRMAETFKALGGADKVTWLAINSGAPGKQGAGLERNQTAVKAYGMPYPVLLDESGEVGKKYGAKTTPHMYVLAPDGGILYAGAIDDSGGQGEAENNLVVAAVTDYRAGRVVGTPASKPFGCSVKYVD